MIHVDRAAVPEPRNLAAIRKSGYHDAQKSFQPRSLAERRQQRYYNLYWDRACAIPVRSRPSPFGETSIRVYRLARAELARERIEWDLRVQDKIRICRLTARTGDRKEKERAYQELKQVLEPHQPFRALTLTILRQHGFGS